MLALLERDLSWCAEAGVHDPAAITATWRSQQRELLHRHLRRVLAFAANGLASRESRLPQGVNDGRFLGAQPR